MRHVGDRGDPARRDTPTANSAVYKVAGVDEGSVLSVAYTNAVVVSVVSGCHIPEG